LFSPDPRCRFHQRFCRREECQKASKAESQRKYRMKLENMWHHQGEKIFAKLASQAPDGVKLATPSEGDEKTRQEALNWGLMVVLSGTWSQVLMERMYEKVLAAGREILRNRAEAAELAAARAAGVERGGDSGLEALQRVHAGLPRGLHPWSG
jgi:hypothetical protein